MFRKKIERRGGRLEHNPIGPTADPIPMLPDAHPLTLTCFLAWRVSQDRLGPQSTGAHGTSAERHGAYAATCNSCCPRSTACVPPTLPQLGSHPTAKPRCHREPPLQRLPINESTTLALLAHRSKDTSIHTTHPRDARRSIWKS
jgi:hypothetical protein